MNKTHYTSPPRDVILCAVRSVTPAGVSDDDSDGVLVLLVLCVTQRHVTVFVLQVTAK